MQTIWLKIAAVGVMAIAATAVVIEDCDMAAEFMLNTDGDTSGTCWETQPASTPMVMG